MHSLSHTDGDHPAVDGCTSCRTLKDIILQLMGVPIVVQPAIYVRIMDATQCDVALVR